MERFSILIDLPMATILRAYNNYFDTLKKPTKKQLAGWISDLAEADILDAASHEKEDE